MFLLLLTLLESLIFIMIMIMCLLSVIIIIFLIRGDNMNKYFTALCHALSAFVGSLLGVNIDIFKFF